uniref:Uncharacterized protein n=1 Tax=Ciona savignyi TaxID=51511 RepID=H2Y4X1_CIOSA
MYDCTRIGNLLTELCKEGKSSGITFNQIPVLPSPNSTGGSSASSLSDVVLEEEVIHDSAEELANVQNGGKSVDIMNLLFKAKDDYDKRKVTERPTQPPNKGFKPVPQSSTKLNISTLFNNKKPQDLRPSSAELFSHSPE